MEKQIYVIIGILVVSVLAWVLFPIIISFVTNAQLDNVTLYGADYSWAQTLFVVLYVLTFSLLPLGALFVVVKDALRK